jgi:hypothetical protein
MTLVGSLSRGLSKGLRQATRSPGLVALLWSIGLAAALPFTLVIHDAVGRSVGTSRVHLDLERGFDMDWYSEYDHEAVGLERLLTPTSVRPAAFLDNLEAWFSGDLFLARRELVALGLLFALVWTLLSGGILHRFAYHERQLSLRRLLGHGAEHFPRFLRLAAITGVLYYGVYRLSRWLFPLLEERMRDVTVERTALAVNLLAALLVVLLLTLVKLVSEYAKAATVLDGRRGMLATAWHAARFVLSRPLVTFGAHAAITGAGFLVVALYGLVAPDHAQAGLPGALWALLIGQAILAVRVVQRLTVSATALEIYRDAVR